MLLPRRYALALATAVLGLAWLQLTEASSTAKSVTSETLSSSIAPPSTCSFRSLNYIVHTLPQQCFTNQWTSRHQESELGTATPSTITPSTADEGSSTSKPTVDGTYIAQNSPESRGEASVITSTVPQGTIHASSTTVISDSKPSDSALEGDADSPLDNAKFLSFEDWKQRNLEKVGQTPEGLGSRDGGRDEHRRRPGPPNNALDFLGEDTEIEIDFGGFVGQGPMNSAPPLKGSQVKEDRGPDEALPPNEQRSKDGGGIRKRPKDAGRTCRERTNYASYDCAATTLKTNSECKGASAILVENKDTYMLNICSAKNKFFIVELCDNILIDTIVLANFEFFSSMFRRFRISVSDRYPVKLDKWREIGTYEARNSREVQAFLVENPLIWARYVRVEMLEHYGSEYYCPLSLFRVHGTTMMEEFNSEMKGPTGDDDMESDIVEGDEASNAEASTEPSQSGSAEAKADTATVESQTGPVMLDDRSVSSAKMASPASISYPTRTGVAIVATTNVDASSPYNSSAELELRDLFLSFRSREICSTQDISKATAVPSSVKHNDTSKSAMTIVTSGSTQKIQPSNGTASERPQPNASQSDPVAPIVSSRPSRSNSPEQARSHETSIQSSEKPSTPSTKVQSSSTQPPASNPTTQESFFKSVHKRLQLLEANSTLSLQYIEEQSRILREAFAVVEKRQSAKTTTFLENLNKTVLTELLEFRQQYDQIWQSTVLELSSQRESSQREVLALSARLSLLADEVVFQKRMAILQFILILFCLGLAIFLRHSSTSPHLELRPFVQNALNRSSANLSKYAPHIESLSSSPSASRPSSRYGFLRSLTHRGSPSRDDTRKATERSPSIEYSPPTPESQRSEIDQLDSLDAKQGDGELSTASPNLGGHMRSRSTPATPEVIKEERKAFLGEAFQVS